MWSSLKKLKLDLLYVPAIPHLGIYPQIKNRTTFKILIFLMIYFLTSYVILLVIYPSFPFHLHDKFYYRF